MTAVLKVKPLSVFSHTRAEAAITSDAGLTYICYAARSLDFKMCLGAEIVVYGERKRDSLGRLRNIVVRDNAGGKLAVICPRTFRSKLRFKGCSYALPRMFRPHIRELGFFFSGADRRVLEIHNPDHYDLGLALLGYLSAVDGFTVTDG